MTRWIVVGVALLVTACASAGSIPSQVGAERGAAVAGFAFATDTFAFPNEIRARHPDRPDLYANYCFVLARGLRQFFAFARFDPGAPRLTPEAYVERVRAVIDRAPWDAPLPAQARIVIPGYATLREFSRDQEPALKQALGGRIGSLLHWSNWRVAFPVTRGQQGDVAREIVAELDAGRLVQMLVTNWPKPELNHTVVAFAYRAGFRGIDLTVWDPNDPSQPGTVTFERERGRFFASHLYDTELGPIRAFRMHSSWWL
ncbi:MAG TPA: hypothetical protein VHT71_06275 [Methylomirabilota bacterium]|nr:hypothetical protein [Methylomirabilota bacterium]